MVSCFTVFWLWHWISPTYNISFKLSILSVTFHSSLTTLRISESWFPVGQVHFLFSTSKSSSGQYIDTLLSNVLLGWNLGFPVNFQLYYLIWRVWYCFSHQALKFGFLVIKLWNLDFYFWLQIHFSFPNLLILVLIHTSFSFFSLKMHSLRCFIFTGNSIVWTNSICYNWAKFYPSCFSFSIPEFASNN